MIVRQNAHERRDDAPFKTMGVQAHPCCGWALFRDSCRTNEAKLQYENDIANRCIQQSRPFPGFFSLEEYFPMNADRVIGAAES